MKVILTQPIQGLGEAGAIKEVADGYARNYLLPRKLAVAATRGSLKQAEAQADLYNRRANKARSTVEKAADAVRGKVVTIHARTGSENRLYGSVTAADVADALQQQYSITIDRRKIELGETIHRLGTYSVTADMGSGVSAAFSVEVASEASVQSGKATPSSSEAPAAELAPASADEVSASTTAEPATESANELLEESADESTTEVEAQAETEATPS